MKTKYSLQTAAFIIVSALASLASPSAMALVIPGWDRPVSQANMSVLSQDGNLPAVFSQAKSIDLVMTQQDGTQSPTGFVVLIDGQTNQALQVASTSKDECGQTVYTLAPVQDSRNLVLTQTAQKMQLTDHSNSVCLDFHKYRWELNIENMDLTRQPVGQMRMVGNPEPIFTTQ